MKKLLIFLTVICLLISITGCGKKELPVERLSTEQIEALREEYPIRGKKVHPLIDVVEREFEYVLHETETFVFGEIEDDASYSENRYGEFYEFPFTVISDTRGKYKKGEKFTLYANVYFEEYNPAFKKGMRAIVPIKTPKDKPTKKSYTAVGSYYVTPEGFVLSAFDEERLSEESFSGLKAEEVMRRIKKLK